MLLAGCQQSIILPDDQLNTTLLQQSVIVSTENATTLTPQQLAEKLSHADLLIIGEEHTNPEHHQIERWLLDRLNEQRPQGSVLLEMISVDQQAAVNDVKRAIHAGDYLREARIQALLHWNTGWPWSLYGNLLLRALKSNYPLFAASLSPRQIHAIWQHPVFPAGSNSANQQVRDTLLTTINRMHGGKLDQDQLQRMLAIQQNRDRFMAQQLLQAPRPALLIAGGFHASKAVGVPLHLRDLHASKPVVLMLASRGQRISAAQADYVWYVPAP